jgi:phosphoesterase RecJ-like protein
LQELGVDTAAIAREVYESMPAGKIRLLGRALEHMEIKHDGVLVTSWLREQDFVDAGADSSHAEGIIDMLRTVQGASLAIVARERVKDGGPETKVSLRSTDGKVDVAAVAALKGGGGHKQAAGFTAAGDVIEVLQWTEQQLQQAL